MKSSLAPYKPFLLAWIFIPNLEKIITDENRKSTWYSYFKGKKNQAFLP